MTELREHHLTSPLDQRPPRSFAEWISFSVALCIVSVIAALIVYVWVSDRDRPAVLDLQQTEPIRETDGKFYIPFELANSGGETVESVQVIAELQMSGEVVESGDLQFDFLSQGEKESGVFIFKRNPREGQLVLRVSSYKIP